MPFILLLSFLMFIFLIHLIISPFLRATQKLSLCTSFYINSKLHNGEREREINKHPSILLLCTKLLMQTHN